MSNVCDVKTTGRLNYIEPTNLFAAKSGTYSDSINFPYEDYNIAVDLTISQTDRYSCGWWTLDGGKKDITFSSSNGTLSFLGGTKIGDRGYLTTNYTDISMTKPETNTSECLGIESISISYNSWLYPQVVIKFVDVRGATVMQQAERGYYNSRDVGNSSAIYKSLFSFPYPMFTLKVKGFYGKGVTYRLTVEKTQFELDAETGNFNITVSFIGYMFGIYSDIPITYLVLAPYLSEGKEYWKKKIESGDFKFNGGTGPSMMTIPDLRLKLALLAENQEAKSAAAGQVQAAETKESRESLLNGIRDEFPFKDWTKIEGSTYRYKAFSNDPNSSGGLNDFCKLFLNYMNEIKAYDDYYGVNHMSGVSGLKSLHDKMLGVKKEDKYYENFTFMDIKIQDGSKTCDDKSISDTHKAGVDKILEGKVDGDYIVAYIDTKDSLYFNSGELDKAVNAELTEISKNTEKLIDEYRKKEASAVEKALGFKPSIRNIFDLMFAHMDTFIHCFYASTKKIKTQLETDKEKRAKSHYDIKSGYSDTEEAGTNSDGVAENRGNYLPPYAGIYKDENFEGQLKKSMMWPGDLKNGKDLEEVNFILDMLGAAEIFSEENSAIDLLLENMRKAQESGEAPLEALPAGTPSLDISKFIPVTTFDFMYKDEMDNPYSAFSSKVKDGNADYSDLITIFLFRAFYYFSTNEIDYFSYKGDNAFGEMEALNVFKAVKDNYSESFKSFLSSWGEERAGKTEGILKGALEGEASDDKGKALFNSWASGNSSIFEKHPFKVDDGGFDQLIYIYHKGVKNNNKEYHMLPLYFKSIEELHGFFNDGGNALFNNKFLIPVEFTTSLYGENSNVSTFKMWETGEYISQLYKVVEQEIKNTVEKDYGSRKGSEFGVKVENSKKIIERINNDTDTIIGNTFKFETDKEFKIFRGPKVDNSIGEYKDLFGDKTVYIKYPTKVIDWSKDEIKNYDNNGKAFEFITKLNIKPSEDDFENKNRVDFKCRLLQEGAYYWGVKNNKGNNSKKAVEKYIKGGSSASRMVTLRKYFEDWAANDFAAVVELLGDNRLYSKNLQDGTDFKEKGDPGDVENKIITDKLDHTKIYEGDGDYKNGLNLYTIEEQASDITDKAVKVQEFLYDVFFTKCTTLDLYNGPNLEKDDDYCMRPYIDSVGNAFNHFMKTLQKIYESPIEDLVNDTVKFEQTIAEAKGSNPFNTLDLKLTTYMTVKTLYDKWLCNPYNGPEETWALTRKSDSKSDFDNFKYADNFYNDIGDMLLVNVSKTAQWVNTCLPTSDLNSVEGMMGRIGNTLYEFLTTLSQDSGGMLMALPQKFGLSSPTDVKDFFTPFSINDDWDEDSSTYVFMYTYKPSEHLGDSETAHIDMNGWSPTSDGLDLTNEEITGTVFADNGGFSVPSFAVTYAKQNQSIFKNIQLNTNTHGATEAGISATMNIAAKSSEAVRESTLYGQDLYKVFSNNSYNCTVETLGNAQITPLMYFQLNNIPFWRGAYLIKRVSHNIVNGNMTTSFEGMRVNRYAIPLSDGAIALHMWRGDNTGGGSNGGGSNGGGGGSVGGSYGGFGDIEGDMSLVLPDELDFKGRESEVTEKNPVICVCPAHGPHTTKNLEWTWSNKVVIKLAEALKAKGYIVQRCNKEGKHTNKGGYHTTEMRNIVKKFGSKKVITCVPHWNGMGGNYYAGIKGGTAEPSRADSIKLMECIVEASEVARKNAANFKIPNGAMNGKGQIAFSVPCKKNGVIQNTSCDGATQQNCACALTENWFADYPKGCNWMANSALNTDANGNYVTMRGWLESDVGINTIVDIHVNGISAYIDYIRKHGLIPCGLPPATAKGGGGGAVAMMTLADAISSGKLVPIQDGEGGIRVYIRYNTCDNIFGRDIYGEATELKPNLTYLTPDTKARLLNAQSILQTKNLFYSIVLWDGIRPDFIQKNCYFSTDPKTKYEHDPKKSLFSGPYGHKYANGKISKGSTHSYGTAVDVSIIDTSLWGYTYDFSSFAGLNYLDMGKKEGEGGAIPGGFDDQSAYAPHTPAPGLLSDDQKKNRNLLYSVMAQAGFSYINPEWWHFENRNEESTGRPSPIIK